MQPLVVQSAVLTKASEREELRWSRKRGIGQCQTLSKRQTDKVTFPTTATASPICSEQCASGHFQNSTVRTHYPIAHQPSLPARCRTYLRQTGSYDVSTHPRHLSVLPTVTFHPRFRHDIQTTDAVFYLTSSRRSAGSSIYNSQAGVSGFVCHRLERPASPRRICAVTRVFQTTTKDLFVFPFLPRYYHMTRVLLYHSSLVSEHMWCLQ